MATYTTVDDDFYVTVFKSFNKLWKNIYSEYPNTYLAEDVPLHKQALKEQLQIYSNAKLYSEYDDYFNDPLLKIQLHK